MSAHYVREVASYRNAAILGTALRANTAYRDATEPEVGINKKEFKKERHAFDQENSKIQEKKKENALSTEKNRKKTRS